MKREKMKSKEREVRMECFRVEFGVCGPKSELGPGAEGERQS
jgi:hypothetical protein